MLLIKLQINALKCLFCGSHVCAYVSLSPVFPLCLCCWDPHRVITHHTNKKGMIGGDLA